MWRDKIERLAKSLQRQMPNWLAKRQGADMPVQKAVLAVLHTQTARTYCIHSHAAYLTQNLIKEDTDADYTERSGYK